MGKELRDELKSTNILTEYNSKNYQVWHHRKLIVEWLQDPTGELEFTENILKIDAKNYHVWQHRQWCIKTFKLVHRIYLCEICRISCRLITNLLFVQCAVCLTKSWNIRNIY